MLKSAFLLLLIPILSIQFLAFAQENDPPFLQIDNFNFKHNEEAFFEENNEEREWHYEEHNLEQEANDLFSDRPLLPNAIETTSGDENTAVAVANAISQIISAIGANADSIGNKVSVNITQTLLNNGVPQANAQVIAMQVQQGVVYSISNLTGNTTMSIRNEIADVVMEGAVAYNNATDNGQDGGTAVGIVVTNAIKGSDNTGNANSNEDQDDQASMIADSIGDVVAAAVNNATAQSQDREEIVGHAMGNIGQAIRDNAVQIGETIGNINTALEEEGDLVRAQVDQTREVVKNTTISGIENAVTTPEQVAAGVTDAMNGAAAGLQADTESFDTLVDNLSQDIANNIAVVANAEILDNTQGQI